MSTRKSEDVGTAARRAKSATISKRKGFISVERTTKVEICKAKFAEGGSPPCFMCRLSPVVIRAKTTLYAR